MCIRDRGDTGRLEALIKKLRTVKGVKPVSYTHLLFYVVNKIGEYPFLNIPLFNQSINHLYLVSPSKAAFIPVAISVAFTALSKNESI